MTATDQMLRPQPVSPAVVDVLAGELRPVVNTDYESLARFHSPRYNASSYDWRSHHVAFCGELEERAHAAPTDQPSTL